MAAKRGGISRGIRRGPTVRYTLHGLVGGDGPRARQNVPRITLSRIRAILLKRFADVSDVADAAGRIRLVVLLLTRPGLPLFESEIRPNVNYWHSRSGDHLDIFCVGFAGTSREFSNRSFVQTLAGLEAMSKWRYGGESELLARKREAVRNATLRVRL